jgi:hypothetical protein
MRGPSGADLENRLRESSRQRLVRQIIDTLGTGEEGELLVAGGNAEIVASLLGSLPPSLRSRSIHAQGLAADATEAEIRPIVEERSSELSLHLAGDLVAEVIDVARSDGRACLGVPHTERALQAGAVDTLVFSRTLAHQDGILVKRLVASALGQAAQIEEIPDAVAGPLDREGGVGARLRFAV